MAVLHLTPIPYNVDWYLVVNFLVVPLVKEEEGYGLKKGSSYMRIIV